MKVKIIMDDRENKKFKFEHGLSLFIEIDEIKILFDTGSSYLTYENIKLLGLEEEKFDYIILSHGHYDHVGGFYHVKQMLKDTGKVIVGNKFFENKNKYHLYEDKSEKFIGHKIKKESEIIEIENDYEINSKVKVCNMRISKIRENNRDGLYYKKGDEYSKDEFNEEIGLLINEGNNSILISGCTHNNLFEFIKAQKINKVIGGLHHQKASDKEILKFVNQAKESNINQFMVFHCTGEKLIKQMILGGINTRIMSVGDEINI